MRINSYWFKHPLGLGCIVGIGNHLLPTFPHLNFYGVCSLRLTQRALITWGILMNDYNVVEIGLQILSVALFFGLPYLAKLIWLNTDKIAFILFMFLFWLICTFVTFVSVITVLDYFYLLIDKV